MVFILMPVKKKELNIAVETSLGVTCCGATRNCANGQLRGAATHWSASCVSFLYMSRLEWKERK